MIGEDSNGPSTKPLLSCVPRSVLFLVISGIRSNILIARSIRRFRHEAAKPKKKLILLRHRNRDIDENARTQLHAL